MMFLSNSTTTAPQTSAMQRSMTALARLYLKPGI